MAVKRSWMMGCNDDWRIAVFLESDCWLCISLR